MNILALLFFSLRAATPQAACPDLSGTYVVHGNDGRVHVTIKQSSCQKVAITWASSLLPNSVHMVHSLSLNGTFHSDSGWFGATEAQMTAATFTKGILEISEKPRGSAASDPVSWTLQLERLANADICTKFNQGSIKIASLAGRQRAINKAAEDEAAQRSEKGCPAR